MNKLAAVVSASLFLSGLVSGQAMALSGSVQSDSALTPFSSIQHQPKIFSEGFVIQAKVGCVVNWVNGACGSPEFVKGNNGGSQAPTPPVFVPPYDPCLSLRARGGCGGDEYEEGYEN